MIIKEHRKIDSYKLRKLCVSKCWYTYGSNYDYQKLHDFIDANEMTVENLVTVAWNIIDHSNHLCFKDCDPNGTTPIQYVLFELARACFSIFTIEGGAEA